MIVRIRLELGSRQRRVGGVRRRAAFWAGRWLMPFSAASFLLACWRLGADLNWTGRFAVSRGIFSHWQAWMGMAVVLQVLSAALRRYGRGRAPAP